MRPIVALPLILLAWVALLGVSRESRAARTERDEVRLAAHELYSAVRCSQQEAWRGLNLDCEADVPPRVGSLVRELLELTSAPALSGLTRDAWHRLSRQRRCQRAIGRALARYARIKLTRPLSGTAYHRAQASARRRLERVTQTCRDTTVELVEGVTLPAVGTPCALGRPGSTIDAATLQACLEDAMSAKIDAVVRRWLRPDIVLILTDDQRWDQMDHMPIVRAELVASGVEFGNGFVATPGCCPSRATLLTGQYAYNHGVRWNFRGAEKLEDSSTLATWLQAAGYRTGFVGKYLNEYVRLRTYVPPGWDDWRAFRVPTFYDYALVENGVVVKYGSSEAEYSTDVLTQKAVKFIANADDRPFYLWFAPYPPHAPAEPAPRHAGRFAGMKPWRPPSYNEADVSDKAKWVRKLPEIGAERAAILDDFYEKQFESLLAADEAVGAIMQALRNADRARNALVVFMSDNGFSMGEHRWSGKWCPYEECVRIPLVIRYPPLAPAAFREDRLVSNVDIVPTIAELAGIAPPLAMDGRSLVGLLEGTETSWRTEILGEQYEFAKQYASLRTNEWKYIEYFNGEVELYNLIEDRYELESLHAEPGLAELRAQLAARLRAIGPPWLSKSEPTETLRENAPEKSG